MISYNAHKLIQESFFNLGLGKQNVVGGPIGSNFQEAIPSVMHNNMDDDEDEDEDEDDVDDEDMDNDEDMGDFPPDDAHGDMGMDDLGDMGDMGMDDLGNDVDEVPDDTVDDMGGDMGGDDEIANVIGELDPALLGDDDGDQEVPVDDDAVDVDMEDDDMEDHEEPDADDFGGEPDGDMDDMATMLRMMKSYMSKDKKRCNMESSQVVDDFSKFVQKEETESDWLTTIANQARGDHSLKKSDGVQNEDALFHPSNNYYDDDAPTGPEAGNVGFAPQGRIGDIGGGYSMNDFEDMPVVGESKSELPTIREYMEWKANYRKNS